MSGLRCDRIEKRYGRTPVLRGVSLDIAQGEFLTLLGPSGCGKSTLLRIIAGLEQQDAGHVAIAGRVVDGLRPKARDIAMVFQSYALYPHMTVARNMAVPLVMRRLSAWQRLPLLDRLLPGTRQAREGIAADVRRVADGLAIGHLLRRKPGQLSGGQRQRVAVGRAMVRDPAVFLMDEPLSNLDAELRVQMRAEIRELHARLGVTFVYVTHDQAEAMTMSDRVAVMMEGGLAQVARPSALYDDPDTIRVARFIGSPRINLVPLHADAQGRVTVGGLPVASKLEPGAAVTVGLRPEGLHLEDAGGLPARLRLLEHLGSDLLLHAHVDGLDEPFIARVPPRDGAGLRVGDAVRLAPDPAAALLFGPDGARLRGRAVAPTEQEA